MLSSCSAASEVRNFTTAENSVSEETASNESEQEKYSLYYIFKDNVSTEEQQRVIEEAEQAILEVNRIFGLELAEKLDCIFDSSYKNGKGENRSWADYRENTIHCVRYTDFVHEYIHMLLNKSPDRIYDPNAILTEGTATYFSSVWGEEYGNDNKYLYDGGFRRFPDKSDDDAICKMLEESRLTTNERNYCKATVAYISTMVGFDKYQTLDAEFVNYQVGAVTVEYLVTQCGGIDKFLSAYFDSIRITDIYTKSLDNVIADALAENAKSFQAN